MGEAILVKTINGTSYATGGGTATEGVLTVNGIYTCTRSGMYQITCVGGGGGGAVGAEQNPWHRGGAGGSGFMKSTAAYLYKDQDYIVTIGQGGANGYSKSHKEYCGGNGTPTSFSDIVYAEGGEGGHYRGGWHQDGSYCNNDSINSKGGDGFNNGTDGLYAAKWSTGGELGNFTKYPTLDGGWLYYHGTSVSNVQNTGMQRLYYGDGGFAKAVLGGANYNGGAGNAGCIIIKFLG